MYTQAALSKINSFTPERVKKHLLGLNDYDLTLADKLDKVNPDYSPMTPDQYITFRDFSGRIGKSVILTARGEGLKEGLFAYMGALANEYGRIPNLEVASNNGHFRHFTWAPRPGESERVIIPVPGMEPAELSQVVAYIHDITSKMQQEFPEITMADHRELCGAVVAKFEVNSAFEAANKECTSRRYMDYRLRLDRLITDAPDGIANRIQPVSKYWTEDATGNKDASRIITKGYTDMLPMGAGKHVTAPIIVDSYRAELGHDEICVIAGGDSVADFEGWEAMAHMVKPENRLFVSVGNGLLKFDDTYAAKHNGERLIDIVLTKDGPSDASPVEQYSHLLDVIGRPAAYKREPAFPALKRA